MPQSPPTGPTRDGWTGIELLQTSSDIQAWRAEKNGAAGLIKIALTEDGQAALSREATLLIRVSHPHVPSLKAAGPERRWLVREYVDGTCLDDCGDIGLGRIVEIGACLAEILGELHRAGLVHADLKPANVVLDENERPHLLDFGTACVELSRAKPGQFRGTLGYAAPEQLQGQALRTETDIYSLGVLLYRLITGRLPYPDADPKALAYLPLATLPEPIAAIKPGLPQDLSQLIMAMLARSPKNRPQDAAELAERLRASLGSPAMPILVGMGQARASLRSLVSVAVRGQGGVVVVYGKKGSGRRSIIEEALESGRREGLPVKDDLQEVNRLLSATLVEEVVMYCGEENSPEDVGLASRILTDRLPCFLLLRSNNPLVVLERRGARHVVPDALTLEDVSSWLDQLGRPAGQASALQRRCKGLPGRILEALSFQMQGISQLNELERRVLELTKAESISIESLAEILELSEHATVDIAERLIDLNLMEPAANGTHVQAAH